MTKSDGVAIKMFSSIDGTFQGYLSHISESKMKVEATNNINSARKFASETAAMKIIAQVDRVSHGALTCRV